LEWTVAGFGDFSGNVNETDMLMRNSNTGAFEVYDISNNAITSAASMGQVGLEWQSQYNLTTPLGGPDMFTVLRKRVLLRGFIVSDFAAKLDDFLREAACSALSSDTSKMRRCRLHPASGRPCLANGRRHPASPAPSSPVRRHA
jgi:hypothetical protein